MHGERARERGTDARADLDELGREIDALVARLREDPSNPRKRDDLYLASRRFLVVRLTRDGVPRGRERVEEAAERACVKIFARHFARVLDPSVRFVPYLTAAGRNAARELLREERMLPGLRRVPLPEGESEPVVPPADPKADADRPREEERMRRALGSLSPAHREILASWAAGLPYREIAMATGRSPGGLRVVVGRLKERVRVSLRGEGC